MTQKLGIHYDMPPGMFPVHLYYPEFQALNLWFPALDAWMLECLCERVKASTGRQRLSIMEIGSYVGTSTSVLARHASYLLCVDTWAGSGKENDEMAPLYAGRDVFSVWNDNVRLFPHKPAFHRRVVNDGFDSLANVFESGEVFDLIFIDGGHDYESVKADIDISRKLIKPGGIICGHDFTQFPGVEQAAVEFEIDGVCGTVWWKEMT